MKSRGRLATPLLVSVVAIDIAPNGTKGPGQRADIGLVPRFLRTVCPRASLVGLAAVATFALAAPTAGASEILTRNASNVRLKVDANGRAVVYYTAGGRQFHPLVWGAVNARPPSRSVRQVHFKIDYSGGWGTFRRAIWRTIRNRCRPYDGPPLPWLVAACKAPDGSYWALQRWQRMLPNLGLDPWRADQRVWELHISHWSGPLPQLEIYLDWIYSQRFHHLFGRFTYRSQPVYGFSATSSGAPLDTYGRNIYVDTYNSAYGAGWKRENSFLTHRARGNFCYGFYPRERYPGYPAGPRRPMGHGERYRVTVMGPGVTPLVGWQGAGLPDYDENNAEHVSHEEQMRRLEDQLHGDDASCSAR
jgi:hypothetical protein